MSEVLHSKRRLPNHRKHSFPVMSILIFLLLMNPDLLRSLSAAENDDVSTTTMTKLKKTKIFMIEEGPWEYPQVWNPTKKEIWKFQNHYLFMKNWNRFSERMIVYNAPIWFLSTYAQDQHWTNDSFTEIVSLISQTYLFVSAFFYIRTYQTMNYMEFLAVEKGIDLPEQFRTRSNTSLKDSWARKENNMGIGFLSFSLRF